MTFATKKEADAHDKMLDIADNVFEFLENAKINLNETQLEETSLLMAENRDALILILRGSAPKKKPPAKPTAKPAGAAPKVEAAPKEGAAPKKEKSKK